MGAGRQILRRKAFLLDPYMSVFFMLTISFPEAVLVSYFAIQFMGGKPRLPEVVLIGLIQAIIAYIVRSLPVPVGFHTLFQLFSYVALLCIIAHISIRAASIGSIAGLLGILLYETSASQLVAFVTGQTIVELINDNYKRLLFDVPTQLAMIATIILFKKYDITFPQVIRGQVVKERQADNSVSVIQDIHKEYLPAVVFIFLPLMLLWMLNFTQVSVQVNIAGGYYSTLFKVLFNTLVIILAFMSLWSIKKIQKSIEKEMEAARAAETIDQLKELILSIRKQRHDFNHQLQAVYGLMEVGNFSGAREYIKNTYHYVSSTGELIKTDSPTVSALLYTKIGIAETRNIKFDIGIDCSLENFPPTGNEASSLLGNLVDNAFDAVEGNEAGNRVVRLDIRAERGEYSLEVANRGSLDASLVEKIFTPNFTTKMGHGGLGLAIVKEITEKYGGNVQLSSGNGETVFSVSIPFKR